MPFGLTPDCIRVSTLWLYGFLFGLFVWHVILTPLIDFFVEVPVWPKFVFALALAALSQVSKAARCVMVLFVPSALGNATQNYMLVAICVLLFTTPVTNIAHNATEAVRVVGCSLTLTFEHMRERAKLMLSPIIEAVRESTAASRDTDLAGIQDSVQMVDWMVHEMKDGLGRSAAREKLEQQPQQVDSSPVAIRNAEALEKLQQQLSRSANITNEKLHDVLSKLQNETQRGLIQSGAVKLDLVDMMNDTALGVKASIDVDAVRRFAGHHLHGTNVSLPSDMLNLTETLHQSCLGIFRQAKGQCALAVDELRASCRNAIGSFLAAIVCSPVTFTLDSLCPWLMNELVDENNLCAQLRDSNELRRIDPFKVTNGTDIDQVYERLSSEVERLRTDWTAQTDDSVQKLPRRIEVQVRLNDKTLSAFLRARDMWRFVTDKYRLRRAALRALWLLYELYTLGTFVCILAQAHAYRRAYLRDIRHDNVYITRQLRKLDERQRASYRHKSQRDVAVLPLTQEESRQFVTTFTCKRRTSEERQTQRANCVTLTLLLAFTLSLLYFDNIFSSLLESIRQHALVHFKQQGHHLLDIRVTGEGSIARLVRSLAKRLSSVYDVNRLSSTQACLPDTRSTSCSFYAQFTYLVLIYVGIDQLSVYAMRLRRAVCALFYPQHEKQRIAYLYNLIIARRRQLARYVGQENGHTPRERKEATDKYEQQAAEREACAHTARQIIDYLSRCVVDSLSCRCVRQRSADGTSARSMTADSSSTGGKNAKMK